MSNSMLWQQYTQLTVEERMRLTLAAAARGDAEEVVRLRDRAPRTTFTGIDPEYPLWLDQISIVVKTVVHEWAEVSHRAAFCAALPHVLRNAGVDPKFRKQWIAMWNAFDLALTRFCADARLTRDEVLALAQPLPEIIGIASGYLKGDGPVDRDLEEGLYHFLWEAWPPALRAPQPARPRRPTRTVKAGTARRTATNRKLQNNFTMALSRTTAPASPNGDVGGNGSRGGRSE